MSCMCVAGGTLSKGLNRACGTLAAGFIAVGAHKVAYLCGDKAEPVLLAVFVFLLCTYTINLLICVVHARLLPSHACLHKRPFLPRTYACSPCARS
jgi:uncharacterized membrane protein YgaE (UPF0421/DUF939 family)